MGARVTSWRINCGKSHGTGVWRLASLRRCEDNVPFGVRDRRPGGNGPDGARGRAADVDGPGAAFGGDEQVAGPDPGLRQLRRGQRQDGVVAGVLVALRETIGKVGGGGSLRHEPGGLHADVAAGRRAGCATVATCPAGSTAYTRPLASSAAIRSPPNLPKAAGATVIPPSTAGAPAAMTDSRPSQPMPNTVVRPPDPAVTSSRCPNRPVPSNAIPDSERPGGRLANRRARPCGLIMTTPGRAPGSRAKAVPFPNEHEVPRTASLPASTRYGSVPVAVRYPPAPRANRLSVPSRPSTNSRPAAATRNDPSPRGPARSTTPGRCRYTSHTTDGGAPARPGLRPRTPPASTRRRPARESGTSARTTNIRRPGGGPADHPGKQPVNAKGRRCLIR